MNLRHLAVVSTLMLGLAMGPAIPTIVAQDSRVFGSELEEDFPSAGTSGFRRLVTRNETEGGGSTVLLEVEDETVRIDAETSRRTRREFRADANGRRRLASTIDEERVVRPDGGQRIVRSFAEPDVNGRLQATRRETEETVPEGGGVFRTRIEVSVPNITGRGFVPTERVEQRVRRDGEQVFEIDRTTYTNPTGRGTWEAVERRIVNRNYRDAEVQTVESIYTPGGAGNLILTDQIVSRAWTRAGGRSYRTDKIFTTDIPGQSRTQEPRLFQLVEVVRTTRSDGGWTTTRTVTESQSNRILLVERVIGRSRPDGRGGTVVEWETQQRDVDGRFQTVSISRTSESGR